MLEFIEIASIQLVQQNATSSLMNEVTTMDTFNLSDSHLNKYQQEQLKSLLQKNVDLFTQILDISFNPVIIPVTLCYFRNK
jgi:hypothetical protein